MLWWCSWRPHAMKLCLVDVVEGLALCTTTLNLQALHVVVQYMTCNPAARLMAVAVSLPELHRTSGPVGDVEGMDLSLCNRLLGVGAPL